MARAATSMAVHDGLLFVSGGDWDDNLGPCPIFAVNPYTGYYRNEWDAGTESVDYFRKGSDGCLYVPSVDPKDGHANQCDVSRRNADGTWTKLTIAPNRWLYYSSSENAAYGTHNWDVAIWKGKIFTAGYGIGVGPEKSTSRLSDGTPGLTDAYRRYRNGNSEFQQSRRFYAFLPFEDDLFCYPLNYSGTGSSSYNSIGAYDYEEWRYDESTGTFVCQTNAWANVTPGLSRSDLSFISTSSSMRIQLWHPTAFKGRVLYIAGIPEMTTCPFALYTATNPDHSVRATRVGLDSGVVPFDIFVHGEVVTVLAAQYDSATQRAVNSVWESTDGVSFTKKFTFTTIQNASTIAWCDGAYYVAMGARQVVQKAWTFTGTDEVGKIYRIRDPAVATTVSVVAESATVSVPEGGSGIARFKLSERPEASVTATVRVRGGVPSVSAAVSSVTFTPQDWDEWHEVALAASEDDTDESAAATLVCGEGDSASVWATSIQIVPVNNDFRVVETPPDGLVDITSPKGDFSHNIPSGTSVVANEPFNDWEDNTNTTHRFCARTTNFAITYDFSSPAAVTAYGIVNFGLESYSVAERAPHTWTFQGSNGGKTWTTLDERKLEGGWTAGEYRYYSFENTTAYEMYRLAITANNGNEYTQFARLEFYGTGTGLVPLTTAAAGGLHTNSASHATYGAQGAFDGNRSDTNGRWLATKADHMYVVYHFNEATPVNMLRVWNGSNSGGGVSSAERSPKAWTFQGSNDGETWTTLDTRTSATGWSADGESRTYSFQNDTPYEYYKFDCTELCSASATYLQIWELEFYYTDDPVPDNPDPGGGDEPDPGGGDDPGPGPGPEPTGAVLVYEGFHSSDYGLAASYSSDAPALKSTHPTGNNIGFTSDNAWSSGTAVPRTIAGSLPFAAAFDNDETNGTGRVVMQNSGTENRGRGIQRKFSAALPTSGTIYYRFLMKLSSNVNHYLSTLQSGGYWAGGLVKGAFNGGQDAIKALTTDGLWMGYKKTTIDGTAALSLFTRIGETDYLLPFNTVNTTPLLSTWSTYIFVARIDIGAGAGGTDRVSVAVQPVASGAFSADWEWAVSDVEANLVSGGTPVTYIAFAGQYQTGGYEVAIDQFKIATSLELVCDHTPPPMEITVPTIGAGDAGSSPLSFVENTAGEECFRVVVENAVPNVYYTPFAAMVLDERFIAQTSSVAVSGAGPLPFDIPTDNRTSLFVTIVASTTPFAAGDEMPEQ